LLALSLVLVSSCPVSSCLVLSSFSSFFSAFACSRLIFLALHLLQLHGPYLLYKRLLSWTFISLILYLPCLSKSRSFKHSAQPCYLPLGTRSASCAYLYIPLFNWALGYCPAGYTSTPSSAPTLTYLYYTTTTTTSYTSCSSCKPTTFSRWKYQTFSKWSLSRHAQRLVTRPRPLLPQWASVHLSSADHHARAL